MYCGPLPHLFRSDIRIELIPMEALQHAIIVHEGSAACHIVLATAAPAAGVPCTGTPGGDGAVGRDSTSASQYICKFQYDYATMALSLLA